MESPCRRISRFPRNFPCGIPTVVIGKCFYILADRSFPRDVMLSKRVVKRVSLGLNFNQFRWKATDKWSVVAGPLIHAHFPCQNLLYIFKRLRPPSFSYLEDYSIFHFYYVSRIHEIRKRTRNSFSALLPRLSRCTKIKTREGCVGGDFARKNL